MKTRIITITCFLISFLSCLILLCGCENITFSSNSKEYTIQYSDEAGLHSIQVTSGALYSIDTLPQKYGYDFMGLFDAKTGGTQYIDETGSSLSAFTDKKNIVLFPQYKAKEYTLILNYQGAAVTGSRSMTVSYDSVIDELPMDLSLDHKEFTGWYTEPNGKGTQIADEYGMLPTNNKVTESIFDFSETDNNIYLYAGFENMKYTVTFYFEDNNNPEEMQVEYGTDIKDVVPETRVNGNAVLTWSKIENDTNKEYVFTGKVTGDLILYATEYAPVIDFDENGGEKVIPVVAREGSAVSLPTPTKENYKFMEWQDENGNTYTSSTMPTESITLKAVWQAKLVFDENGGTEVTDISKAVGESITLPTPEKEGYIFAGWYTADKEKYESKTMPATGMALKAGWYAEKTDLVTVLGSTKSESDAQSFPSTNSFCYTFNYYDYFPSNETVTVKVDYFVKLKASTTATVYVDFYSRKEISSAYLIETVELDNVTDEYKDFNFNTTFTVEDNYYICFYCSLNQYTLMSHMWVSDFYYIVTYPDTTVLYL